MRRFLIALLICWAIAFFGSFIAFYLTPAKDFGLSAGWNKVGVFMAWQGVALVLAFLCLALRWSTKDEKLRRWAVIPTAGLGVLAVGFGGLLLWASIQSNSGEPLPSEPRPTTAPTGTN